jgi:hypothetical protein
MKSASARRRLGDGSDLGRALAALRADQMLLQREQRTLPPEASREGVGRSHRRVPAGSASNRELVEAELVTELLNMNVTIPHVV